MIETLEARGPRVAAMSVAARIKAHQEVLDAANTRPQTTVAADQAARRAAEARVDALKVVARVGVATAVAAAEAELVAANIQHAKWSGVRNRRQDRIRAQAWPSSDVNPESPSYLGE